MLAPNGVSFRLIFVCGLLRASDAGKKGSTLFLWIFFYPELLAECEVNAMLDLVKQETERIDSRFLEPACGDGKLQKLLVGLNKIAIDEGIEDLEKIRQDSTVVETDIQLPDQ